MLVGIRLCSIFGFQVLVIGGIFTGFFSGVASLIWCLIWPIFSVTRFLKVTRLQDRCVVVVVVGTVPALPTPAFATAALTCRAHTADTAIRIHVHNHIHHLPSSSSLVAHGAANTREQ